MDGPIPGLPDSDVEFQVRNTVDVTQHNNLEALSWWEIEIDLTEGPPIPIPEQPEELAGELSARLNLEIVGPVEFTREGNMERYKFQARHKIWYGGGLDE
jgi:hypothetical protein